MDFHQLQPRLDEAQKALEAALKEACGVDLSEIDTGELIRIEETIAMASIAAKEAVSLRLRLRSRRLLEQAQSRVQTQSGVAGVPRSTPDLSAPITHRVFEDIRGKRWHAFAVHASSVTVERRALPEPFRQGWLVFESGDELRRVAPIPHRWAELPIDDLRLLCHKAASVPRRTSPSGGAPEAPEAPGDSKPQLES